MSKYNVGLKTLLLQGLSEPEFYGDLVYKFRKIIGKHDFPHHFNKPVIHYNKICYNIDVFRQTACLAVHPVKVNSFVMTNTMCSIYFCSISVIFYFLSVFFFSEH